jgi:hypothetical protein
MKKSVFIAFLCVTLCFYAQGEEKPDNRYAIKFGYSRLKIDRWSFADGNLGELKTEVTRFVGNCLEIGVYAGYSRSKKHATYISDDGKILYGYPNYGVWLYGVGAGFHILPLFAPLSRFDAYVAGKLGGYHIKTVKSNGITASIGIGASYCITRHFGAFAEYGYGLGEGKYRDYNYENETDIACNVSSARFGIFFKF